MKKSLTPIAISLLLSIHLVNCQESSKNRPNPIELTSDFKSYWYQGEAEISTYELSQNRYGELRNGTATLIYVTEDFLPIKQVKADISAPKNIPVLKLNSVKKFTTGIYPYSIMQSSFSPLKGEKKHALKTTASIQEWCGQTFMQLNNKKNFEIDIKSYFASEGDQKLSLQKSILENELWNLIRIHGDKLLPKGEINCIPSFEFLRLNHKKTQSYKAIASIQKNNNLNTFSLTYPELKRSLKITFQQQFPYIIESWSEEISPHLPTTAKRITTKLLPYWNQNSNKFTPLRKELGLQ
ncbi:hypothetical protein [Aquimarina agarilytica]|uniref:hypothetical protein n=1 Tax=Aquimarina agarilytica TaxID=1087449 RepID=UPI0004929847|nr:hypothetical protein [Aquimarina agarilytica]